MYIILNVHVTKVKKKKPKERVYVKGDCKDMTHAILIPGKNYAIKLEKDKKLD